LLSQGRRPSAGHGTRPASSQAPVRRSRRSSSPDRPLLGISELGRQLGLNRSTTHRYVATLAGLGYLLQDPVTRKYRLGPRVLDLGFSAINSMELREIATPHLQELSDATGHTVNMAILDGDDIVYIERVRCSQPGQREIDLNLHVGSRLPAYCTSMGKVLLAHLPDAERANVVTRVELARRGRTRSPAATSSPGS
jgi:IclR family pca regulon transcriptional regulator